MSGLAARSGPRLGSFGEEYLLTLLTNPPKVQALSEAL